MKLSSKLSFNFVDSFTTYLARPSSHFILTGACIVGVQTQKIIDFETVQRYCHRCVLYGENHANECRKNYHGSAAGKYI